MNKTKQKEFEDLVNLCLDLVTRPDEMDLDKKPGEELFEPIDAEKERGRIGAVLAEVGFPEWALQFWHEKQSNYSSIEFSKNLAIAFYHEENLDKAKHWENRCVEFVEEENRLLATVGRSETRALLALGKCAFDRGEMDEMNRFFDLLPDERFFDCYSVFNAIPVFLHCGERELIPSMICSLSPFFLSTFYYSSGTPMVKMLFEKGLELEYWALVGKEISSEGTLLKIGIVAAVELGRISLAIEIATKNVDEKHGLIQELISSLEEYNQTASIKHILIQEVGPFYMLYPKTRLRLLLAYAKRNWKEDRDFILKKVGDLVRLTKAQTNDDEELVALIFETYAWLNFPSNDLDFEGFFANNRYTNRLVAPALVHSNDEVLEACRKSEMKSKFYYPKGFELSLAKEKWNNDISFPIEETFENVFRSIFKAKPFSNWSEARPYCSFASIVLKSDRSKVLVFDHIDWKSFEISGFYRRLNVESLIRLGRTKDAMAQLEYIGEHFERREACASAIRVFVEANR